MTNKFLTSSLSWLRKSLTEQQESLTDKRAPSRSQSVIPCQKERAPQFWTAQHSFDAVYQAHTDPFEFDDEEVILDSESSIISLEDAQFLSTHLPARLCGSIWHLLFSTETHGFSLSTIYRVAKEHDPELKHPVLLAIRDVNQHRFGAYLSECPKIIDKCFGSGESFVFKLQENDNKIFKWGEHPDKNLFILCSPHSLGVGVDDGKFAIYLDSALNQGRSQTCQTFGNEPLTPEGDFIASQVELWTFR